MKKNYAKLIASAITISLVSSVASAASFQPITKVNGMEPSEPANPYVKVGAEYQVNGVTYTPAVVNEYDVVGISSWYGEEFNGKKTANGEIFDMEELTAAHPTLPLPSFVEVTNVENGKKVVLRVNDRGPFVKGRTLDVSKKAAEVLGFDNDGTTNVRVRLLSNVSKDAAVELNRVNMQKNAEKDAINKASDNLATPAVVATPVASKNNIAEPAIVAPVVTEPLITPVTVGENKVIEPAIVPVSSEDGLGLVDKDEILKSSNGKSMKTISLVEPTSVKSYTPRGVFVQVGAYSENNEKIRNEMGSLSSVGVVSLQKVDVNGKDILRLRVGPYGSIDDAIKIKENLVRLGYKNSRVIIEQ